MSNYRCCGVPKCTNTSIKTPAKIFIHVPAKPDLRKKWLQLARRDINMVSPKTKMHFCEDHFDLPKDMENYMELSLTGSVKRKKLREGCLPSKFACQIDRQKRMSTVSSVRTAVAKRQKISTSQECNTILEQHRNNEIDDTEMEEELIHIEEDASVDNKSTASKCTQANILTSFRSKATQCSSKTKCVSTSPKKISVVSSSTSPLKLGQKSKIVLSSEEESSNGECDPNSSDNEEFSETACTSDDSFSDGDLQAEMLSKQSLQVTERIIKKKPLFYIGIPEECYFLIEIIHKNTHIPVNHILLCLKKIRLNTTFSELGDNFGISLSYGSKIFLKNIPKIADALRPFIQKSNKAAITKNLPIAFRHKYYKVSYIIDCFEIEIQKPSNAVHQALTWSSYKSGNTIKYFIASTPDGVTSYISPGYGGRISDNLLIEDSKFLDTLEPGDCILADRGFKHIEPMLRARGVELQRPPTVTTNSKLSKLEVRQTRAIACLRIHIERVIRRVREYSMLVPHSCINSNLIRVLDDCLIIACALINLQNPLIR